MSTSVQPEKLRHRPPPRILRRAYRRWGGSTGNEVLTSVNAVMLVVLLAVQGVTIVALHSMIRIHLFIGVVLLGPVILKLATTGYRFFRYYTGAREYREKGPPPALLRAIAPVFVLSTIGLFASGVAMLLQGHGEESGINSVHVLSFWVWLACLAVHVAFNAREVVNKVRAEWLTRARDRIPGAELRAMLVLASVLGGVLLALSLISKITGFNYGD